MEYYLKEIKIQEAKLGIDNINTAESYMKFGM